VNFTPSLDWEPVSGLKANPVERKSEIVSGEQWWGQGEQGGGSTKFLYYFALFPLPGCGKTLS
jgi:hypothetical protein